MGGCGRLGYHATSLQAARGFGIDQSIVSSHSRLSGFIAVWLAGLLCSDYVFYTMCTYCIHVLDTRRLSAVSFE